VKDGDCIGSFTNA
jgi:hypothetical protein